MMTVGEFGRIFSRGAWLVGTPLLFAGCVQAPIRPIASPPPTAVVAVSTAPAFLAVDVSDEEFIGPFSSWVDVKARFGAKGDGVADDTAAIQRGLDALRKFNSSAGPAVLYFPTGAYRISRTLTMKRNAGASLVGADPSNTVIKWAGPADGTMLLTSGAVDTLFTRLTWDGESKAGIGVAQWWNSNIDRDSYQGGIKHVDEVFQNLGVGIYGGRLGADYGQGDSETLIERVTFLSNSIAGVNVGSFNALNWWIWDSQFKDCARGVTNRFSVDDRGSTAGAGNFMIYRSFFRNSAVADVEIGNTGWFSLHESVSIGSRQFILAGQAGANGGAIIVQGNRVIDTINPVSIQVGNEGPLMLIDNRIRSRFGVVGPVVRLDDFGSTERDALSLGNQYTIAEPIAMSGAPGRVIASQDATVQRDAIANALPDLPGVAKNFHRRVFEIPLNATQEQIQAAIDLAAASKADNAVVHLPAGDYHVDHSLIVPASVRLQIAGDSMASTIWWTGRSSSGPIIRCLGPSRATLRDIRFVGQRVTAINLEQANQAGGRVFVHGSRMAELQLDGMSLTRVDAQANTTIAGLSAIGSAAITVFGAGGMGPQEIAGNSNVLIADSWYEGDQSELFRGKSGTYTFLGGMIAPYNHGIATGLAPDAPAIRVDNFSGKISYIGLLMDLPRATNGIEISSNNPEATTMFFGVRGNAAGYFKAPRGAAAGLVMSSILTPANGTTAIPDEGVSDISFVVNGFQQSRSVHWEMSPFVPTPGATDVRFIRVSTVDTAVGLTISP